jgi:hypothetical protein
MVRQVWRCQCLTTTPIGGWGCGVAREVEEREVWQMGKVRQEIDDLDATTRPFSRPRSLMRAAASLAMTPPERKTCPTHIPFDKRESMTLLAAAKFTGKPVETIKNWCLQNGFDGRVGSETWIVSGVALAMMLEDDMKASRVVSLDRPLF